MKNALLKKAKPRKAQIKEKAGQLFGERGYSAGSMRQLARIVGIEAASLYNHYASKEAILSEICEDMAAQFLRSIEPLAAAEMRPDLQLQKMMRIHLDVVLQNRYAATVFFHEWRYLEEPYLSNFKEARKRYRDIFGKVLSRGASEGYFAIDDLRITLSVLFSSMNWAFEQSGDPEMSAEEVADRIYKIISRGILTDRKI